MQKTAGNVSKLSSIKEEKKKIKTNKAGMKSAPLLRFQNLVSTITLSQSIRNRVAAKRKQSFLEKDIGKFEMSHSTSPHDDDRRPITTNSDALTIRSDVLSRVNRSDQFRFVTEPNRKFQEIKVQGIIKEVLEDYLEQYPEYHAKTCQELCPEIAECIKDRVKRLVFPRYKIVCHVTMGQMNRHCIQSVSRCAWNEEFDNFAQYCVKKPTIYAIAVVYGIYAE